MARVTRPGGLVAACVWDKGRPRAAGLFWRAVREVDPGAGDLSGRPGTRERHLASLFAQAGLTRVQVATAG
jgi:hypothetical protein